jgi:hypothetical protein
VTGDWQKAQAERFGSDARPPAVEPAVDAQGDWLWLDHTGWAAWLRPGVDPGHAGWRRLYVEREPNGEPS